MIVDSLITVYQRIKIHCLKKRIKIQTRQRSQVSPTECWAWDGFQAFARLGLGREMDGACYWAKLLMGSSATRLCGSMGNSQ